jgi:hypothetical protein
MELSTRTTCANICILHTEAAKNNQYDVEFSSRNRIEITAFPRKEGITTAYV